jgi:hypothetical protein
MPPIPEDRPASDFAGCDVVGPAEPLPAFPSARRALIWNAAAAADTPKDVVGGRLDVGQVLDAVSRQLVAAAQLRSGDEEDFREEISRQALNQFLAPHEYSHNFPRIKLHTHI